MMVTPAPGITGLPPGDGLDDAVRCDLLDEPDATQAPAGPDDADDAGTPAPWPPLRAAPTPQDEQLAAWIERIVERDERALCALYDATLSRVYGLVLRVVRRAALAEEVVEETYFQVWRQAVRFDPARGGPMTWLLGMARSRAIDALRREARYQHDSLDDECAGALHDDAPHTDALLAAAQGHAELQRALLQLQSQPRQLVALAFFRGLSHEEIASQCALPLGTVKSQIRRALITLRQIAGDAGLAPTAS